MHQKNHQTQIHDTFVRLTGAPGVLGRHQLKNHPYGSCRGAGTLSLLSPSIATSASLRYCHAPAPLGTTDNLGRNLRVRTTVIHHNHHQDRIIMVIRSGSLYGTISRKCAARDKEESITRLELFKIRLITVLLNRR